MVIEVSDTEWQLTAICACAVFQSPRILPDIWNNLVISGVMTKLVCHTLIWSGPQILVQIEVGYSFFGNMNNEYQDVGLGLCRKTEVSEYRSKVSVQYLCFA